MKFAHFVSVLIVVVSNLCDLSHISGDASPLGPVNIYMPSTAAKITSVITIILTVALDGTRISMGLCILQLKK